MDELVAEAKVRMAAAPHHAEQQYAEVLFMRPDELTEFYQLRMKLPTAAQMRATALENIRAKRLANGR